MALTGKNIIVTGGTGFIGSHLVERLVGMGANVTVPFESIDSKSYFKTQALDTKVKMAYCDLKNFQRVFDIVTKSEVDYIFHLAAQPLVTVALDNPLETFQTNIMGTVNILESARLYGKTSAILVTSSDKAYGKIPRASENNPLGGDHPYETSKASADLIATTYFKTYKLPIVITRFGNVYGEGDINFNRIIPGIMKAIILKKIFNIRSNGKFIRDYIYVNDVVDSMTMLVSRINKSKGEAFNVSSLENLSVIGVIKKVEMILGCKISYNILSNAAFEIPQQSVNFSKIKNKFGWKPKNNLEDTIVDVSNWYQKHFAIH